MSCAKNKIIGIRLLGELHILESRSTRRMPAVTIKKYDRRFEKEVIALEECPSGSLKVVYAHRPNPNGDAKIYDKGGWNIPNLKYWLDCPLPE